jgi:2-succinyl-5-enolpyruvyl-6-hydroxy-3-cyclohexene-1-carboxylate synthase
LVNEGNCSYSNLKNVQIIIALLKEFQIKHIVISPGNRHVPFSHSIEHDPFFTCYSIVDERSASFFALGLIQELKTPVAVCCTSGTAACNYSSGVAEALYQQLPLLVITADRNPYYLFQQEEQMVPQQGLFRDMCKKEVSLPIVRDEKDFWYCARLVNEALLELEHREKGPVHINFPVENDYPDIQGIVRFQVNELPYVKKINRLTLEDDKSIWESWANDFSTATILILYGQMPPLSQDELESVEAFCHVYNCVISVDLLSNLSCSKSVNSFLLSRLLTGGQVKELSPNILITMNANPVAELKHQYARNNAGFRHIHVSKEGKVSDPFKCLPDIIECSPSMFFKKFVENSQHTITGNHKYYEKWAVELSKIDKKGNVFATPIGYSSLFAVKHLVEKIPEKSLLHLANSNSVRMANFFPLDKSITVYCNRGTNGIDGSLSAFIGQASIANRLSFLIIGDLSFFYDMNALWNHYIGSNLRILVCNNAGGAIFYSYPGKKNIPSIDLHTATEHNASVKNWVKDRGFIYLSANDEESFETSLSDFLVGNSNKSMVLEVFTTKEADAQEIARMPLNFISQTGSLKKTVAAHMPATMKAAIKKVLN